MAHRYRHPGRRHPVPMRGRRTRPQRCVPAGMPAGPTPAKLAAPSLGEILLRRGEITSAQLAEAFVAQLSADLAAPDAWLWNDPEPLAATMLLHHQTPTLDVTNADVERGYVDVPAGTRFSVATTSREGYLIDLVPKLAIFTACTVRSAEGSAELGPDGGTLVQRSRPRRTHDAELSFRFVLAGDVGPGRYRFPLDIVVRPL